MKNTTFLSVFVLSLLMLSCGGNSLAQKEKSPSLIDGKLPNPENSAKNSPDFSPAFAGQTRTEGIKTATPFSADILTSSLENPWGIVNFSDGKFLITSKKGYAVIVSEDGKTITKISGFPKVDIRGQGGLLDIALDPDFKNNRMIFFSFSEPYQNGNHTAVGKGRL